MDDLVFPPMDEAAFEAKLAKWKAKGPKPPKEPNNYGRPTVRQIPKEQWIARVLAVQEGRETNRRMNLSVRRDAR
jgi:hypothetical protein